jgi:hypothetical protein
MPSAYTAEIYDGEQEFREFALGCSTSMMYDRSVGTAMTPESVVDTCMYHAGALLAANRSWDQALAMTDEEATAAALANYEKEVAFNESYHADSIELRGRVSRMMGEVAAWEAPSEGHEWLRELMQQQLDQELKHAGGSRYDADIDKPLTGKQYRKQIIDTARSEISYHTDEQLKQTLRNLDRAQWTRSLLTSLSEQS